ncbi:MAG: hypothetical protein MI725_07850 [Pirellulales bacterium]|nr:hypothetical protein [Pirellulales bacterium]
MKRRVICGFLLVLAFKTANPLFGATQPAVSSEHFTATVLRYFASTKSYRRGDLISQSQLAELQTYLRRTQGLSPATHRRLLKRALPDRHGLVKFFHNQKYKDLLRAVAEKSGGYAALDNLSRPTGGRKQLENLLDTGELDALLKTLAELPKRSSAKRVQPIYTADDFLAAVQESARKPGKQASWTADIEPVQSKQ